MRRTFVFVTFVMLAAAPAYADLTLKQTVSGGGMGIRGTATGTTYIKGNKMRSEMQMGDRVYTTIFDLDAQKMYAFDSKKKEAQVWDMSQLAAELSTSVNVQDMKVSLKPNGQTKQIAGQTATGYDLEITVPAGMGGNKDMMMLVTMSGPTWIVKNAPGTKDYIAFYKTAAEKGWIFGDPRAAKAQPGQAKATAEMYRLMAETGGIAYENDLQIKMSFAGGNNPLGGLMAKMGNTSMQMTVQSADTTPLSDDLFAPPADYKLKPQK
ncbi:MAG TPA: hypothetical protein VNK41_07005 [Vicinamibacterales bacterium]|nr:hypothetical protein [Vicinamibacterales bacterium]